VQATRASYQSPRLRPPPPEERQLLPIDAVINARGIRAHKPFLEALRALAIQERNAINVRLNELTSGVVTSVDQVQRIRALVNERGHDMASLGKRSVAATLAHGPDAFVTELLQLRQRGAYASVRMAKRLLAHADPDDQRIRGSLRIFGAGPGRWSSPGAQLHNLRRNDAGYPAHLVNALIAGDRAELARYGNPLEVAAQLSRAALCARPGHVLVCADFGAIESRVLAWFAGEEWKLDAYRRYDATGDKTIEPYRVIAARMLYKDAAAIGTVERQQGKSAELACGFGGSVGAWRRIAGNDERSDDEVRAIIQQWRNAHPAIRRFWKELALAARAAIRTGGTITVGDSSRPHIIAAFDGYALTLTLPSGRVINYPGARLVPNAKFEGGDPDIEFFDNANGQWKRVRGWFGTLVENVVQGTVRDLLAAAIIRFEHRNLSVCFHCHDEAVIEAAEGTVSDDDVLAILLEPPAWSAGLPLAGKVHSGPLYLGAPETPATPLATEEQESVDVAVEQMIDVFVAGAEPLPATRAIERGAEEDFFAGLDETTAPLTDLVSLSIDSSGRVSCPFHDDLNPSCSIYPDHYYCHACGARGTRLEWLLEVEGLTKEEAIGALQDWPSGVARALERELPSDQEKLDFVLSIWDAAVPLRGTIGERYLAATRGIDVSKLPASIHDALRFHPRCVFGSGERHPCIIALMRDPETDAPTGIHRIGLAQTNGAITKLDRWALGRMGVVKLWPLNGADQIVVGEGIETVLAAATKMPFEGAPLVPAWSAVTAGGLARLPVLDGVERLILLIDNDENGEGQKAAERSRQTWSGRARSVVPLLPEHTGWDFNDVILGRKA
jgi:DNA polymerase